MNPFTALGLPPAGGLADEQVRAAWRATAAATHPDRPDGGNPAAYAAAQAAYAQLRTPWGRAEALADISDHPQLPGPPGPPGPRPVMWPAVFRAAAALPARARRGRPRRLAARAAVAAAAAFTAVEVVPGTPAAPAVAAGCALWWALTARADLAPPPGR